MRRTNGMVTAKDIAGKLGVRPLTVRRILRSLKGTLQKQKRGVRWLLTPEEVAHVKATVQARKARRR